MMASCLETRLGRSSTEPSHVDVPLASHASRHSGNVFNPFTPILLTDLERVVDLSHFNVASSGDIEALHTIEVTSFFVEVVDDVLDLVFSASSSADTAYKELDVEWDGD